MLTARFYLPFCTDLSPQDERLKEVMLKRFSVTAGATLMTIAIGAGSAAAEPAAVESTEQVSTLAAFGPPAGAPCSEANGTIACFEAYGDKFWVKDTKKDGYFSRASWGLTGDGWADKTCSNHLGSDAGWTLCNYNMPENDSLSFKALTMKSERSWVYWGTLMFAKT
jgi:hypothetical protein